jgi:hypothetical protein
MAGPVRSDTAALLASMRAARRNFDRSLKMSKNKLLIAITAGLFAASGAFAQTSSGNSAAGMGGQSASPAGDNMASGTMTAPSSKHKAKKHSSKMSSSGKKTPEAETGNNPAAENGQSK